MLSKETKDKINNARDILVGQLPLPSDQIELITIALIYKFMDDIDEESRKLGGEISFFRNGLSDFSWQKLLSNQLSGEERVQKFIRAIEAITKAPHIPELFKSVFRNTFLKFRDSRTLKLFLDEINKFKYEHSEELGNAFEYLLDSMGSQGENGQFRTPRNIIDFIIEVVDPDKLDKILDPACGTAGFLISAYKHILRKYTNGYEDYRISLKNYEIEGISIHWGDKLKKTEIDKLTKRIEGYDITPLMVRLSQVNMYLHHFPNPLIHDYDTLSNKNRWEDKFDCIFANPPFMTPKGGVEPHEQFRIRAKKAEILFSDYIIEHLNPNGKAGWIVPEGIIFQGSGDYVTLRKWLIENMGLWAVVSLPAGIFQPYSGVKTSILFVDRVLARNTNSIILVKVENDGFSLNTNRNPISDNDLPDALNLLMDYKKLAATIEGKPEESEGKLAELAEKYPVKFKVLNRKEFAKLDSYKAVSSTIDFCKREYKRFLKAKEKYEESYQKAKDEKQKQKALDTFHKNQKHFIDVTGFETVPFDEGMIKLWVNEKLKDDAVKYGEDRASIVKLSQELREYLDNEREFNLSIEKYTNASIITSNYELVNLGDYVQVIAGQSPSSEFYNEKGEGLPFYQGKTEYGDYYLGEPTVWTTQVTREAIKGDLLFSMRAPVGEVNFNPFEKICIGRGLSALRCSDQLLPQYLFYSLRKLKTENFFVMNNGAVFDSIKVEDLTQIQLPLPPADIQQKIVDEIEGYQKVIDGCNLVINNYKPSFKIDDSWERVKLGEVCEFRTGGTPRTEHKEYYGGDIKWLVSGDIHQAEIFDCEGRITEAGLENSNAKILPIDSVLIALNGQGKTRGTVAILKTEATCNQSIAAMIINNIEEVLPYFIYLQLKSRYNEIRNLTGDNERSGLNMPILKSLDFYLPSVEVQSKIVSETQGELKTIQSCQNLKTQMEQKIKEVIDGVWGRKNQRKVRQ
ncbi:MAG: N-6 DNA methylase [Ignavibacteriota bacterium]|nr:restriction endonuclease subunit M/S [Ignavibacteriota bacterium]MCO6447978.1 N-6 DNA methylase [Ignavibacterium album]MCZ2268403.1 N-6 DNA methylase [Ignavibacteriales bacterium]QKJ98070.1 MAG: N-6 DNA methylase [Ignavibacteriota bacterium]HOJ06783.1 N-6 DNA methylase [Ignavibacteriaceae bacterium]